MRKMLSFALALVLLLGVAAVSLAAESPSVSTLTYVVAVQSVQQPTVRRAANTTIDDYDTPLAGLIVDVLDATAPAFVKLLENVQEFIAANADKPIVDYFGDVVKQKVMQKLPANVNVDELDMNEFVPMQITGFAQGVGDVWAEINFATTYRAGQAVVPVAGIYDANGEVSEWLVLEGEVDAQGQFRAKFTEDDMTKLGDKPFAMAVLSEK